MNTTTSMSERPRARRIALLDIAGLRAHRHQAAVDAERHGGARLPEAVEGKRRSRGGQDHAAWRREDEGAAGSERADRARAARVVAERQLIRRRRIYDHVHHAPLRDRGLLRVAHRRLHLLQEPGLVDRILVEVRGGYHRDDAEDDDYDHQLEQRESAPRAWRARPHFAFPAVWVLPMRSITRTR